MDRCETKSRRSTNTLKIIEILSIYIKYIDEGVFHKTRLSDDIVDDPYWKTVGLFRKDALFHPAKEDLINNSRIPLIKLQRTGETIINKFAGNIFEPEKLELYVKCDKGKKLKIIILNEPREDGVSSKEGYVIGIYDD